MQAECRLSRVPRAKRKAEEVEDDEQDFRKENLSIGMDSEGEGEANSDQREEWNLFEVEEFGEGFSGGEEDDDYSVGGREKKEEEKEKEDDQQDAGQGSTAFSRAFGKIMSKRVAESAITEISGPILAARKQLLVKKFEEAKSESKERISSKEEKRELREKGHELPLAYVDAKERALMRLATKGVVRLFNAVSKAQKVQADADISSSKAAKATWKESKTAFMTELRASHKSGLKEIQADQTPGQDGVETEHGWAALRTDFMLGTSKKLMDWDKGARDLAPI